MRDVCAIFEQTLNKLLRKLSEHQKRVNKRSLIMNANKENCDEWENKHQDGSLDDKLKAGAPCSETLTENKHKPVMETFFSTLDISFINMQIVNNDGIPTVHFLRSCDVVNAIFDLFGSPVFLPIKMDISGNLRKIENKYKTNPTDFVTLQDIVLYEISTNTHESTKSGTDALKWLKRGLEFVYEFLLEFSQGNPDIKRAALSAYRRSLSNYHGWIVRGIITAAMLTVPSRREVLTKLALHPNDIHNPLYEEQIKEDARLFLNALDKIIKILNEFYTKYNLDKFEVSSTI